MPSGHNLYTIAPVLANGWVLLGETGKFITMSPNRITSVAAASLMTETPSVRVTLTGAPHEAVTLLFIRPPAATWEEVGDGRWEMGRAAAALQGTLVNVSTTLDATGFGTVTAS